MKTAEGRHKSPVGRGGTTRGARDRIQSSARVRAIIGLSDQGVYSVTNFILTVLVARAASRTEFGAYAVLMATYLICMFVARGLTSETYVVRFSAVRPDMRTAPSRACTGAVLCVGVAASIVIFLVGLALGRHDLATTLVFVVITPGVLLQDALRYIALAAGRPLVALTSDICVAVVQISVSIALIATGSSSPATMVGAWGGAACVACAVPVIALRVRPRPFRALDWFREHRSLAVRYALDDFAAQGINQAVTYALALIAGLSAAGAFRAGQSIFGPLVVVFAGVMSAVTPELVRLDLRSRDRFRTAVRGLSVVLALLGLVVGVGLALIPHRLGIALFGASWQHARPLLIWLGLMQVPSGWRTGAMAGLRALGAARRTLRARGMTVALGLAAPIIGVLMNGALGAAIALALATPPQALVWWWNYHRACRESPGRPVPAS